ncbi:hypothetical protein G6F56_007370 [Rhizopus delemar]|nr:hypothetical protein G6F56_007370 [Rhizopus delemar]
MPKRGANKQYIESLENRIQVMEKAIHSLGGMQMIEEAMRRQQLLDENPVKVKIEEGENRFLMNEMGSPYYIQDIMSSTGDSQSSRCSSPKNTTRQDELVQFFMLQIQPYFSLFLPDHFNQLYSAHEIPSILIHAMCALSLVYQASSEEEKSHYYHKAVQMLDEWVGRPCVEMIQTLLILVKYTENNQERSKSLLSRAIELCKILDLERVIYHPDITTSDTEIKRKAFYMVLRYHALLCVEQNIELELFIHKDSIPPLPNDDTERLLFHFNTTLSHIYHHLQRITKRQDSQMDQRNDAQIVQETLAVMQLNYMMDEDMLRLPSHLVLPQPKQFKFPADELPLHLSLPTKLVYIHHHLNQLLLHFHYAKYPLPRGSTEVIQYPHQDIALSSASALVRWVESLLADPMHRLIPRGLHWLTYCSTLAFSVLQLDVVQKSNRSWFEEYQRAMDLTQSISLMSPFNEIKFNRELNTSCHSSPVIQPMIPTKARRNTISDRPMPIPSSFLQLSSTDLSSLPYQPLNMQAPLQLNTKRTLRNTSQSCMDLRSMNQIHSGFNNNNNNNNNNNRKSSNSTLGPYRHSSPTKTSYSKPYDVQNLPRQHKVRKSSSLQALPNQYYPPNLMSPVDFSTPFLDSNETESQFPVHWTEFDFQNNHHMLNDERTEGHALL